MASYIGVLEGFGRHRRRRRRYGSFGRARHHGKRGRRAAMKSCARHHKVTSRGFHACVRRKTGGSFGRYHRRRRRR